MISCNPEIAFQKLQDGILKQHKTTAGRMSDPQSGQRPDNEYAKPVRSMTERRQRNLETAMPACTRSGSDSELRIKMTLPDSKGLRAELPEVLPSGDVVQQSDVRTSTFQAQFTKDPNTGELQAGTVCLEVTSPDFIVQVLLKEQPSCASHQISLELDPEFDTRTVIVSLRAKNPNNTGLARVFVRAYQNGNIIAETALSTQLVKSLNEHPSCGMWQLQMAKMTMGLGVLGGLATSGAIPEITTEEERIDTPAQIEKKKSERELLPVDEDEIDTTRVELDAKLQLEEKKEDIDRLDDGNYTIPAELQDQLGDVPEVEAPEPEPVTTDFFSDIDATPGTSGGNAEPPAPPKPSPIQPAPDKQSQDFDLDFIDGSFNDDETVKSASQRSQTYGSNNSPDLKPSVDDGIATGKSDKPSVTEDVVTREEAESPRSRRSTTTSNSAPVGSSSSEILQPPAPQSTPMRQIESKTKSSNGYLRPVGAIAVLLFVAILGYGLWSMDDTAVVTEQIRYGDTLSATLDDSTDELEYIFTARAGDVITIVLLLPIEEWAPIELLLFDEEDEIIAESYSMDGIESLTIPADGEYTIVLINPISDEIDIESVDFELILILDEEG